MVFLVLIAILSALFICISCSKNKESRSSMSSSNQQIDFKGGSAETHTAIGDKSTRTAEGTPKSAVKTAKNKSAEKPKSDFKFQIAAGSTISEVNKTNLDTVEGEDNPLLNKKIQEKLLRKPPKDDQVDKTQSIANTVSAMQTVSGTNTRSKTGAFTMGSKSKFA